MVTDITYNLTTTASVSYYGGVTFTVSASKKLDAVNIRNGNATKAYVYSGTGASPTLLGTFDFSGTRAEITGITLNNGTTYFIAVGKDGATYNMDYTNAMTYPISGTNVTFTGGVHNSGGWGYGTTFLYGVYSVETSDPAVAPVAAFSGTPLSNYLSVTTVFTDASTNTPTSWSWKKNDGSGYVEFSTDQNPTETFDTIGTYDIKLTATNIAGSDDEEKLDYITVSPPKTIVIKPMSGTKHKFSNSWKFMKHWKFKFF